jgi:hypothetical protein
VPVRVRELAPERVRVRGRERVPVRVQELAQGRVRGLGAGRVGGWKAVQERELEPGPLRAGQEPQGRGGAGAGCSAATGAAQALGERWAASGGRPARRDGPPATVVVVANGSMWRGDQW